jgi:hypothetical protein
MAYGMAHAASSVLARVPTALEVWRGVCWRAGVADPQQGSCNSLTAKGKLEHSELNAGNGISENACHRQAGRQVGERAGSQPASQKRCTCTDTPGWPAPAGTCQSCRCPPFRHTVPRTARVPACQEGVLHCFSDFSPNPLLPHLTTAFYPRLEDGLLIDKADNSPPLLNTNSRIPLALHAGDPLGRFLSLLKH